MTTRCDKCDGSGVVEKDNIAHECICAFTRRIAAGMPPYMRSAIVRPEHMALPLMNATRKNCRVQATWQDMRAIMKALIITNSKLFVKNTSDREIRDVFVGNKSRAARGADETGAIYNSLEDLMDPPDLMIVRLNELSYKNRAAAGALEEALNLRLNCMKPTWVLSDLDRPFTVGSHAYSESLASIIATNFVVARVPRILPTPRLDDAGEFDFQDEFPAAKSMTHLGSIVPESASATSAEPPKRVRPQPEPPDAYSSRKKTYEYSGSDPDTGGSGIDRIGRGVAKSKKFQTRD